MRESYPSLFSKTLIIYIILYVKIIYIIIFWYDLTVFYIFLFLINFIMGDSSFCRSHRSCKAGFLSTSCRWSIGNGKCDCILFGIFLLLQAFHGCKLGSVFYWLILFRVIIFHHWHRFDWNWFDFDFLLFDRSSLGAFLCTTFVFNSFPSRSFPFLLDQSSFLLSLLANVPKQVLHGRARQSCSSRSFALLWFDSHRCHIKFRSYVLWSNPREWGLACGDFLGPLLGQTLLWWWSFCCCCCCSSYLFY